MDNIAHYNCTLSCIKCLVCPGTVGAGRSNLALMVKSIRYTHIYTHKHTIKGIKSCFCFVKTPLTILNTLDFFSKSAGRDKSRMCASRGNKVVH